MNEAYLTCEKASNVRLGSALPVSYPAQSTSPFVSESLSKLATLSSATGRLSNRPVTDTAPGVVAQPLARKTVDRIAV
ncbi:MAG TPA: hypothetical protein VIQ05_18770 [Tardiphaga sp.]